MIDSSIEYQLVLEDLKTRLKAETNPKKIKLLEKAILEINEYINFYNGKSITKNSFSNKTDGDKKEEDNKETKKYDAIYDFLICEMFSSYHFTQFKIFNMNKQKLETTTFKFVKNEKFKLLDALKKSTIIHLNEKRKQCGTTIYIKALDESYVFISKNDLLTKGVTLIHELGHVKVNDVNKAKNTPMYFGEVYPKFLELVYSDYLMENGLEKHGYNLKISMLKEIQDHIFNIKYYKSNGKILWAPFNYKLIKDNILAISIYMMYKKEPKSTLNKLNNFIKSLGNKNEEELLSILDLNNSIFTDINLSNNFAEILKTQIDEMKQSRIRK